MKMMLGKTKKLRPTKAIAHALRDTRHSQAVSSNVKKPSRPKIG